MFRDRLQLARGGNVKRVDRQYHRELLHRITCHNRRQIMFRLT